MMQNGWFLSAGHGPRERDRVRQRGMLTVQEGVRREEKTKKTKAMPWSGAAFVFSVFAVGRKLRVLR
jgi:hypothetical protein